MPTRIALTFGEDKVNGVINIRKAFHRFMTNHGWEMDPPTVSKTDLDDGIGEIWDTLKSASIASTVKATITGDLNISDDEQIAVLIAITLDEIINQYRAQLPGGTGGGP
jgi:hypothetical protein